MKVFLKKSFFVFALVVLSSFSFAAAPLKDQTVYLQNGIPLYYKKADSTKMCALVLCVRGGTVLQEREYSGLESSLFDLMAHGSKKYPYEHLQRLSYDKQISIGSSSGYAGSFFTLSCIDYYFNEALEVFLDCFLNPAYDEKEFSKMQTEFAQEVQSTLNDPEDFLGYSVIKEIYKGHPLGTVSNVIPESEKNITIENMKALYKTLIDAKRIFLVASGNIDIKKLQKVLNKSLGKIPSSEKEFFLSSLPDFSVQGSEVVLHNASVSKGSGHMARVFKGVPFSSSDYMAARICALMYDEALYNIVREKHGACYTPSTSISFSPAPFGNDFFYRVSDFENIKKYVDEARESFLEGRVGGESFSSRLPGFVNKYIASAFMNQKTTFSIASRAANSLLLMGEINGFDKNIERARAVTAGDIERVFKKYWCAKEDRWFLLVAED